MLDKYEKSVYDRFSAHGNNYSAVYAFGWKNEEVNPHWHTNGVCAVREPKDKTVHECNHTCHASIQSMEWKKFSSFVNIYRCGTEDWSREFIKFILGPDSPYSPAHLGLVTMLENEERGIWAYSIPQKVFQYVTDQGIKAQLYNMMIALRVPGEYPAFIRSWYNLVKEGMHPSDAYIMCGVIDCKGERSVHSASGWDGAHKPLSIGTNYYSSTDQQISPTKFRKGEYDVKKGNVGTSSVGWRTKKVPYENFKKFMETEPVKTRFSRLPGRSTKDVIEHFNQHFRDL